MASPSSPGSRSAFFYGTLMAPQVLSRVCHGQKSNNNNNANPTFQTHPAILHNYRRHRVRHADYPAILPCAHASVRGTYVTNLTDADIWRLDIFEGDQYAREVVTARLLLADDARSAEGEEVRCETYVWIAGAGELEDGEWDFEQFRREKMRFWVGAEGEGEYAEVDEAVAAAGEHDGTGGRGANGHISQALDEEHKKQQEASRKES